MRKIQVLCVHSDEMYNSVSKAFGDVAYVASQEGFEPFYIKTDMKVGMISRVRRIISTIYQWKKLCKKAASNSVILIQYPLEGSVRVIPHYIEKLKKKNKIIALVHDIHSLRTGHNPREDFDGYLRFADSIIVHNDEMKKIFIENGYKEDKLVSLEIFDYILKEKNDINCYDKNVILAGVLDKERSPYIYMLKNMEEVEFDLYGPKYDGSLDNCSNIKYHGSFKQDELPFQFNGGFGLIWDGNSLDECTGFMGKYLQINNPHKTSLYMASGIPVIIWDKAAIGKFVKKYNVGYVVSSIREIPPILEKMNESEYNEILKNVKKIQEKVTTGYYSKKAIEKAMEVIKNIR